MKREFPSGGYHTRLLCLKTLRDTTPATFQMHPCPARNRRSGRRSNTANALVMYAPQAEDRSLAQEDLRFHPALAYKYSGEYSPSKVVIPSEAKRSRGCNADEACGARVSIP